MKKQELATLACKLLGIYFIITGLEVLPSAVLALFNMGDATLGSKLINVASIALPAICSAAAGFYLWSHGELLGEAIIGGSQGTAQGVITAREAQIVAFSVIGLYQLMAVPAETAQILGSLISFHNMGGSVGGQSLWSLLGPQVCTVIVNLFLGLWLLLNAPTVSRMVDTFKNIGRDGA